MEKKTNLIHELEKNRANKQEAKSNRENKDSITTLS